MSLKDEIIGIARSIGITDVGFADTGLWSRDPIVSKRIGTKNRPDSVMQGARTAIVMGIPIPHTTLMTAPSIAYNQMYRNVNSMLDIAAQRISMELMARGYQAMPIPRDGYHGIEGLRDTASAFFSHRHAAYLAGLGTFGVNNIIITPRNGPRIRWVTVLTDASIEGDGPMKEEVCIHCNRCVSACPQKALSPGNYPEIITDKTKCIDRSEMLARKGISPCGLCIAVCPVGLPKDSSPGPTDEAKAEIQSYVRKRM
ncbi:MAG: epoxyqueuosine reductase [Candidatus Methanomethylophilaceae archaeon]|nr:epoxyqueuosine reductase [Candidatus Methanomethylophilaceae archaeon]